ncbi:MAG TPA: hypothetical protein P5204_00120 [Kiritimatiellia bacterium]|nr:hypothetical protein [Kiritimatiellia bacterium]
MSLREFVRRNRTEIDAAIASALGKDRNPYPNDEERRDWVLNDEGLYNWAREEGVPI